MDVEKHSTSLLALSSHSEAMEEAVESGKWMSAVWRVKDGKIELVKRTTWDFPTGDFLAAVAQLANSCFESMKESTPPKLPLPRADGFPRISKKLPTKDDLSDSYAAVVAAKEKAEAELGRAIAVIEKTEAIHEEVISDLKELDEYQAERSAETIADLKEIEKSVVGIGSDSDESGDAPETPEQLECRRIRCKNEEVAIDAARRDEDRVKLGLRPVKSEPAESAEPQTIKLPETVQTPGTEPDTSEIAAEQDPFPGPNIEDDEHF